MLARFRCWSWPLISRRPEPALPFLPRPGRDAARLPCASAGRRSTGTGWSGCPGHGRAVVALQVLQLAVGLVADDPVPCVQGLDPDDVHVPPLGLVAVVGGDHG